MPTCPRIPVALATLLLFGFACSESDIQEQPVETLSSPIVGGVPTAGYGYAVALYDANSLTCSGTLISDTLVVTAAHCLDDVTGPLRVFFGVNALKPWKGTVVETDHYTPHPLWDPATLENDIGVVRLAEEAPVDPAPLLVPGEFGSQNIGEDAHFLGFGATNWHGAGVGVKRQVDIPIIGTTPNTFRYADPNGNTCFGDSGGGGFIHHEGVWKLIGVTSYGDQWCQIYGVSTRVDANLSWLAPLIEAQGPAQDTAIELNIGQQMGGTVAAGDEVLYWFPTFDNLRYHVFVETEAGDVDLYVHDSAGVSPQLNTCASEEDAGEPELCTIPDGGTQGYWAMVKGNAASMFRITYVESDSTCHAGQNGEAAYCTEDCPCVAGEGDCEGSDDVCALGLVCSGDAIGPDYGLDEGVFVCGFQVNPDPEGDLP